MKKRTLVKICVVGLAACITTSASASELLGQNYLGAVLNTYKWGDSTLDNTIGRSYGTTIFGNYNMAENWDFHAAYAGMWDGYGGTNVSSQAVMAGLTYFFPSECPVTPFIEGSAGVVHAKVDPGGASNTESDAAFGAQIGAEWNMCREAFLDVAATYAYVDTNTANNNGEYGLSVSTGVEIIEHLMAVAGASYSFEEDDSVLTVGAIITY